MRLYNDAEDQDLLTPGRRIEFIMDQSGPVMAEITAQTGEGWFKVRDQDNILWPIKSTCIELIDDGDSKRNCWYYTKTFKEEGIQIKPEGYYLGKDDFLVGRSSLDMAEVESILLHRGVPQSNVEKIVKEFMGSNRRESTGGDAMDGRRPCPVCNKVLVWMADGSRPRVHKCEPMETPSPEPQEPSTQLQGGEQEEQNRRQDDPKPEEPAAKPAGPSVDQVIAAYIKTRDEIAAEKKVFEDRVAGLKRFQEAREKWLSMKMTELGVTNLKKEKVGIAFFKTKSSATIADATQFTDWVLENWEERNHFLERRVSKTAVDEALEAGETQPPGVNYTTVRVVQVQRA